MPADAVTALLPRPLRVERASILVEGHRLEDVVLGGWAYGPELGTAPIVVVVGGITASPFPFGDATTASEPWWPALSAPDLVDVTRQTVLALAWPGNGSTWRGLDDGPLPPISALGLADLLAAWLDGIGCS